MHIWREENFDWDGLNKATDYIDSYLRKFRVNVNQAKEKFGTCRIYCFFGWYCLLNITHPGNYSYRKYPKWLIIMDIYIFSKVIPLFNFIILPIHKWVYRRAYLNATKKYPHLITEICCSADYKELLDFYNNGEERKKRGTIIWK